jgi:uncharacterized membrane protein
MDAIGTEVPPPLFAIVWHNLQTVSRPTGGRVESKRSPMNWNRWYVTKSYLSSALWTVPLIALVLENIAIRIVFERPDWLEWMPWFGTAAAGASVALNTVETLTISFIVFTFGSILIAIQVASGQLTPRIIATALLRNNVIRFTVGLFTFTMLFAVGTGARIGPSVITHPAIVIAWILGIASIAAFLFLIDYTARLLRPISIVWRIGEKAPRSSAASTRSPSRHRVGRMSGRWPAP